MSDYPDAVARWLPNICSARHVLDVTCREYPADLMLALIEIESHGDPQAHREGSQFWGLLQISDIYIVDACDVLEDTDPFDAVQLHGDGGSSIETALAYFERWSHLHRYQPSRIAALHKGGAGTAVQVREELRDGASLDRALEWVEEHYRDEKGRKRAPGLVEYVGRFRRAREKWSRWMEE